MGSPSEGWPEFLARVFVLHQVFTQNTSASLRMRSTHPSNLLCMQRHSVPQNSIPPKVTLWPHRGRCSQPCLTKEQHQCPAHDCFLTEALTWTKQSVWTVRPWVAPSKVRKPAMDYSTTCQCSYTFTEGGLSTTTITWEHEY